MYSDLQSISPEQYMKQITKRLTDLHAVSVSKQIHYSSIQKSSCVLSKHFESTHSLNGISWWVGFLGYVILRDVTAILDTFFDKFWQVSTFLDYSMDVFYGTKGLKSIVFNKNINLEEHTQIINK